MRSAGAAKEKQTVGNLWQAGGGSDGLGML